MIGPYHTDESLSDSTPLDGPIRAHLRVSRRHALDRTQGEIAERVVFAEKLREGLERRSRPFPSFSLLCVHIPRVTLGNDTSGFPTESHIVDAVITKLRRELRAADCLIRSGEHGFVIFLSKASQAGANTVAARLQSAIDQADFFYESVAFRVKIDVTVASVQVEDTVETILARADRFLLERKILKQ